MKRSANETSPLPQTFEEASDWFVQFRLGEMGTQAREAFSAWLCRSPDHIRAYLQIAQTYADLPALKENLHIDLVELAKRARSEDNVVPIDQSPIPLSPVRRNVSRALRGRILAVAAAFALVVLGVLAYLELNAHRIPIYTTATGEQRSFALPDGSTVTLNAQSSVRVRLSESERGIDLLAGQALFNVAKDKNRPFVVRAADTAIRAVGTAFDVNQRKRGTTVTVIEGRVAVALVPQPEAASSHSATKINAPSADSKPRAQKEVTRLRGEVYLSAGQELIVEPGLALKPRMSKPGTAIAWTQRRLIFEGTSLKDVVEEFNRYNTRPLVLQGDGYDDVHISGSYSSADPAALLKFLQVEFGLSAREATDQIVIRRE